MYANLTNNIVASQLGHYLSLGQCMGRSPVRREAMDQLVAALPSLPGKTLSFHGGEVDSYFFTVEFDGLRLMMVYQDEDGQVVVESIDELPAAGAEMIVNIIDKAIHIKTLEWFVASIDRNHEMQTRGLASTRAVAQALGINKGVSLPPSGSLI